MRGFSLQWHQIAYYGSIVWPSYKINDICMSIPQCEHSRKKKCEIHNDKWILNWKLLSERGIDGLDIRQFDGGSTE